MIAEAFLSHDARHGIKHAREVTEQLTDAVNRQTSAINHIVSLPTVNDTFFRLETEQAERLITDTLHKLFQFDGQQTQALETAKSDFQTMKKYIDQLETMYTGPRIEITGYKSGSILKSQEEEKINQTFCAINSQMKQADNSPMELMLKKLGKKEIVEVDSLADPNRLENMIKSQKVTKKVYSEEDIKKLQKIYITIDGITYCAYVDGNIIVKIEYVKDESPETGEKLALNLFGTSFGIIDFKSSAEIFPFLSLLVAKLKSKSLTLLTLSFLLAQISITSLKNSSNVSTDKVSGNSSHLGFL